MYPTYRIFSSAAVACVLAVTAAGAQPGDIKPSRTVVLGGFVGQDAARDPANVSPLAIDYYGTDLGFSYEHKGRLHFLFGDTMAHEAGDQIEKSSGGKLDDSYGSLDLAKWNAPEKFSPGHLPPVLLGQNPNSNEAAAIDLGRPMEGFKTPIGGFSNASDEYIVFFSYKPLGCQVDSDCPHRTSCDTGLGEVGTNWKDPAGLTFPCIDESPFCRNSTVPGAAGQAVGKSGFCIDKTSSNWTDTPRGRIDAAIVELLIGKRDTAVPKKYSVDHIWHTRKFMNSSYRTVRSFDEPGVAGAAPLDYHWIDRASPKGRVFIWGRPHFVGVNSLHRTVSAYFAYVDLPAGRQYTWKPRFFAGLDAKGEPKFTSNEDEAKPLDLDSRAPGVQAEDPTDVIDQVSVAWVPPLSKWVMLYGGGLTTLPVEPVLKNCGVLELFIGPECKSVQIGNGAVRMRTADAPWGPWSPSHEVLVAGDPAAAKLQYGPGGSLYHPDCKDPSCAQPTRAKELHEREYGFFYAPNVIEQWTRAADGGADIYWNLSTWDPYRVVLVRTHLSH